MLSAARSPLASAVERQLRPQLRPQLGGVINPPPGFSPFRTPGNSLILLEAHDYSSWPRTRAASPGSQKLS